MPQTAATADLRRSRARRETLIFLAFGAALGCSPATPIRQDNVEVPVAHVSLRIGQADGDAEYTFGNVWDVATTQDGNVFVADSGMKELRQYDAAGRFITTFGRLGEGPGEYSGVRDMEPLPGNRVSLMAGNGKVVVYARDGSPEDSFRVPHVVLKAPCRTLRASADGTLVVPVFDAEGLAEPAEPWQLNGAATHFWVYRATGELIEQVPIPAANRSHMGWQMPRTDGNFEPFVTSTMAAWSPLGHMVYGRNSAYELTVANGQSPIVASRSVKQASLRAEERELWLRFVDSVQESWNDIPIDARHTVQRPEDSHIPDTKPFFRGIFVADDGKIWVHRYVTAELDRELAGTRNQSNALTWREPPTYDVFGVEGDFLASVRLPDRTRFCQVDGNVLWGVQADAAGHEYIVRMEAKLSGGGSED